MTRGYFVSEKAGLVEKAAYLPGNAYLKGYGQEIIKAYAEGKELELLEELHKRTDIREIGYIRPGWYRETVYSGKDDFFEEYGYVLTNNNLSIYNFGKRLFCTNREDAKTWLDVIGALDRFELAYLYSEDKLCYQWNQYHAMFKDIAKKIKEGKSFLDLEQLLKDKNYIPSLLQDEHLIDVFCMPDKPAYQKRWKKGNASATFIVMCEARKWKIFLQLPFCRIPILAEYASESRAVKEIRHLLISKESEMESFSDVFRLYEKYKKAPMLKEKDLIELKGRLEKWERHNPWFAHQNGFAIKRIVDELSRRVKRENDQ